MVNSRHIDLDARMVWLSLRREQRPMGAAQVRAYWNPTFSLSEVVDLLQRLLAGRHVAATTESNGTHAYFIAADCLPLPGCDGPRSACMGAAAQ